MGMAIREENEICEKNAIRMILEAREFLVGQRLKHGEGSALIVFGSA
jgi:hypothetical protein